MDFLTRRKFLLASGVTGAATLAAGATWFSLNDVLNTSGQTPADSRTLVLLTLYGGNDGLNTVIPFADAAYQSARPELAYQAAEVLQLNADTGLNPSLKGLHRVFTEGRLAIVRGVGYPKPDRSHFRSMDIWHTAEPVNPGSTGWIGRWLDSVGGDPLRAVSFEQVLPPLLAGSASAGAVVGVNGIQLPRSFSMDTVTELGQPVAGESPLQARAASSLADLARVDGHMKDVKEKAAEEATGDGSQTATATGGQNALEAQLSLVAQCVEARVSTRVYSVSLGGFDTHADEKNPHQALLAIVDRAMTSFLTRMSKTEAGRKVTVVIYSEFGRRVRANASDGTDHGAASDVMLLGHEIKGGFYGAAPSLTDLDDGDLKYTTDFRDVYASVLENVLNADASRSLGGWAGRLPQMW